MCLDMCHVLTITACLDMCHMSYIYHVLCVLTNLMHLGMRHVPTSTERSFSNMQVLEIFVFQNQTPVLNGYFDIAYIKKVFKLYDLSVI